MSPQTVPWWMIDRGFESSCRVCMCWNVQGYHWSTIQRNGMFYAEFCIPSDNLEYLEWCIRQKDSHVRID